MFHSVSWMTSDDSQTMADHQLSSVIIDVPTDDSGALEHQLVISPSLGNIIIPSTKQLVLLMELCRRLPSNNL